MKTIREKAGLGCLGSLLAAAGASFLLYWSWCWGWWGQNRLFQHLFQCSCPAASAEGRYPDNVDVLVSACVNPYYNGSSDSPSGRYAFFIIRQPTDQTYLYDQKYDSFMHVDQPSLGGGGFLTDEMNFYVDFVDAAEYNKYYLYTSTGQQLVELNWVPMGEDYSFDPAALEPFRHAERVIVTSGGLAVALAPDFVRRPEANFVFGRYENQNATTPEQIIKFLQENGIKFEVEHFEKANVILPTPKTYLIGGEPPSPGVVEVPQPLLRQRVPLDELAPEARPAVEARWVREEVDKRNALVVLVIGVVALVGVLGLSAFEVIKTMFRPAP